MKLCIVNAGIVSHKYNKNKENHYDCSGKSNISAQ